MNVYELIFATLVSILVIVTVPGLTKSEAQIGSFTNSSVNTSSVVTVSSSVTIPVSNQSIKSNEVTLKSAVIGFLNSGPNVLKTSDITQTNAKTKIDNQINNATQIVEGIEATNAIVGVEVGKALRSVISSTTQQGQSGLVTITTSSTCKPSILKITSCENIITIK